MKKYLFLLVAFVSSQAIRAQQRGSLALNLYGSYAFQDKVNFDGFYGYARPGFEYGGGLEYFLHSTKSIEIKYLRLDTHLPLYGPAGAQLNSGADKGSLNFILIGGNNYFASGSQSNAIPYAGADLGVGIVDMTNGGSTTKFAWDAKLGVKIKTSSAVSLKLQAFIQNIISCVGSDLYHTAGGAVVSVPDYASIFQFGLGGAITFDFKHKR